MSGSVKPISTPPGSTLSTPSPTELAPDNLMTGESKMKGRSKHIYLVVATTPVNTSSGKRLGIGLNGKLPWPSIRSDMDYFKLVTRDGSSTGSSHGIAAPDVDKINNIVIMGRKTWSSIPGSFRPLSHRVNVIVTRSKPYEVAQSVVGDLAEQRSKIRTLTAAKRKDLEEKAQQDSSSVAAQRLQIADVDEFQLTGDEHSSNVAVGSSPPGKVSGIVVEADLEAPFTHYSVHDQAGEVFCIGGAEIYGALLKSQLRSQLRILQTEIIKMDGSEFECDTFWPEDLESSGWKEVETREVHAWTGIDTPQGLLRDCAEDEKVRVRVRVRGWQPAD